MTHTTNVFINDRFISQYLQLYSSSVEILNTLPITRCTLEELRNRVHPIKLQVKGDVLHPKIIRNNSTQTVLFEPEAKCVFLIHSDSH